MDMWVSLFVLVQVMLNIFFFLCLLSHNAKLRNLVVYDKLHVKGIKVVSDKINALKMEKEKIKIP